MCRLLKISGHSLAPEYRDGDFVLVSKIPVLLNRLRIGDKVVFYHQEHGRLIKRIERLESGGEQLFVIGSHAWSIDSRQFGTIRRQVVLGKVILHVKRTAVGR